MEEKKGVAISVMSGKGGVGKTVISANLAYIVAHHFGLKTLLIDANITTSHLSSIIKLPVTFSLNEVLSKTKLDVNKIPKYDDLYVLPSNVFVNSKDYSNLKKLPKLIEKLKKYFDVIIVDTAPGLGREAVTAALPTDFFLLVTTPFSPAVLDIVRLKHTLALKKPARVLINMSNLPYQMSEEEIKYITGYPVIANIPYDDKVIDSIATGDLLAKYKPSSSFVKTLKKTAFDILSEYFYLEETTNPLMKLWERMKTFFS